jgi:hypothetical protein
MDNFTFCWSQWPRGRRHELSSLPWTLGSWVRIPLEAWMSGCVYSVDVLSSGIATGWSLVQRSPTECLRLWIWSETKCFTDPLCSKLVIEIVGWGEERVTQKYSDFHIVVFREFLFPQMYFIFAPNPLSCAIHSVFRTSIWRFLRRLSRSLVSRYCSRLSPKALKFIRKADIMVLPPITMSTDQEIVAFFLNQIIFLKFEGKYLYQWQVNVAGFPFRVIALLFSF